MADDLQVNKANTERKEKMEVVKVMEGATVENDENNNNKQTNFKENSDPIKLMKIK